MKQNTRPQGNIIPMEDGSIRSSSSQESVFQALYGKNPEPHNGRKEKGSTFNAASRYGRRSSLGGSSKSDAVQRRMFRRRLSLEMMGLGDCNTTPPAAQEIPNVVPDMSTPKEVHDDAASGLRRSGSSTGDLERRPVRRRSSIDPFNRKVDSSSVKSIRKCGSTGDLDEKPARRRGSLGASCSLGRVSGDIQHDLVSNQSPSAGTTAEPKVWSQLSEEVVRRPARRRQSICAVGGISAVRRTSSADRIEGLSGRRHRRQSIGGASTSSRRSNSLDHFDFQGEDVDEYEVMLAPSPRNEELRSGPARRRQSMGGGTGQAVRRTSSLDRLSLGAPEVKLNIGERDRKNEAPHGRRNVAIQRRRSLSGASVSGRPRSLDGHELKSVKQQEISNGAASIRRASVMKSIDDFLSSDSQHTARRRKTTRNKIDSLACSEHVPHNKSAICKVTPRRKSLGSMD